MEAITCGGFVYQVRVIALGVIKFEPIRSIIRLLLQASAMHKYPPSQLNMCRAPSSFKSRPSISIALLLFIKKCNHLPFPLNIFSTIQIHIIIIISIIITTTTIIIMSISYLSYNTTDSYFTIFLSHPISVTKLCKQLGGR